MTKVTVDLVKPSLEKRLKLLKKDENGFHATVRWTLFASRVIGLFPLTGLTCSSSNELKFTLTAPYSIIYFTSIFGQFILFFVTAHWLVINRMSLTHVTKTLFYSTNFVSSLLLAHIGRFWSKVIKKVEEIEGNLPPFNRNVAKICNITTFIVLFSALLEHIAAIVYGITVAKSCSYYDIQQSYFLINMPWFFDYTSYSLWKGILLELFNNQSTFMWSFNDLLIIVISIYLTEHFNVHNQLLKKAFRQDHFNCEEFRKQYLDIFRLVKLFNKRFGIYVIISFASNLFWICIQLFYTLNSSYTGHVVACQFKNRSELEILHGIEHSIYFTYSFSFLVARTLLVLLLAARVHSSSKGPLFMLYDVPKSRYDIEIQRYIDQINHLKVALSGFDFFYVTRTMILTVVGTIITYELVLLQFNQ